MAEAAASRASPQNDRSYTEAIENVASAQPAAEHAVRMTFD